MNKSTITQKGQTTVPKYVRETLGLCAGTTLKWKKAANGSFTVVAGNRPVTDLKGLIPKTSKSVSIDDMNDAIERSACE